MKKTTNILATGLLVLMFLLALTSIKNDSATMDELPHIASGYSYITQKDMRLNPEHPPLLKDLAGLSVWIGSKLTAEPINFPDQAKSWKDDINGQWDFGREFLYRNGNNADNIIFFARLPMILIMLLLGFYVFKWTRELYGDRAGLIALFLYSLSPTFLAHGRYVTTDVGAATAFFIASYYLIKWLKQSNKKNLIIAGIVLGLAFLTKFSLALIVPFFVIITIVWAILQKNYRFVFGLFLIGLIAMALVWPVYQFHTWNYAPEQQLADAKNNLQGYDKVSIAKKLMAEPVIWMSDKPILRPYAQFFTGLLMVMQRAVGGNTTYFLGEISRNGWYHYFPIVFLIKVPLAFLILILVSLAIVLKTYILTKSKNASLIQLLKNNFAEFALLCFFIIYWATSIKSNLNIGVRHILPVFPILYVLVSGQISKWLNISFKPATKKLQISMLDIIESIKTAISICFKTYFKYLIIIILFAWYAFGTIQNYPYFLTYFNEIAGGPSNGYKYVTDSNLDWGQDLKRLVKFTEEKNIDKIYIDYFGGGSLEYYLKDKYQPWWGDRNPDELPSNSWLAISATFLQGGKGKPNPEFNEKTGYYNWLNQHQPITIIGNSIFVYYIE
ncbi:MAG: glycosyltransferase family 39 protein [bacterium]